VKDVGRERVQGTIWRGRETIRAKGEEEKVEYTDNILQRSWVSEVQAENANFKEGYCWETVHEEVDVTCAVVCYCYSGTGGGKEGTEPNCSTSRSREKRNSQGERGGGEFL